MFLLINTNGKNVSLTIVFQQELNSNKVVFRPPTNTGYFQFHVHTKWCHLSSVPRLPASCDNKLKPFPFSSTRASPGGFLVDQNRFNTSVSHILCILHKTTDQTIPL